MANLNKYMLIGRLTRDPEVKTFANGGKVAKMGVAVNNRRKNQQTGQYEDDPVFLDCECFNRHPNGRQADLAEQLRKGSQIFIEGHLKLDQWTAQDGGKRSRIVVVVDNFQFLDAKPAGPSERREPPARREEPTDEFLDPPPPSRVDEEIPF